MIWKDLIPCQSFGHTADSRSQHCFLWVLLGLGIGFLGQRYWAGQGPLLLIISISELLSSDTNSLSVLEVMKSVLPSFCRDIRHIFFFTWTLPYGPIL